MDWVWASVACVLLVLSFVGCVVPVIPGPLLAFGGLLVLMPSRFAPSTPTYIWFGVACAGVLVLDYVVPAFGAKKFNCSKLGVFGCAVGTLVGIAFFPLGLLLGPFLGAVVGELIAGKSVGKSVWGGIGAFIGFLAGTFLKLVACSIMAIYYAMSALDMQSKFPI